MRLKRLDGLRAAAIVMVVLSENSLVDLGWTGVELFFVLSGFLMTRILRDSRTNKSYWSRFYLKRAVRVVPLLLLAVVVNKLSTHNLSPIGVAGYALFMGDVVNVTPYAKGALGVLWSIAVGAHFLLLWSVAVRFLNRRTLLIVLSALLVAEPVLRHFYTRYSGGFEPIFYLTPFRLDSLAAGSLLALLVEDAAAARTLMRWSGWAAVALTTAFLVVSYLFYPWFVRSYNTVLYNTTSYSTLAAIYFFVVAWVLFLREGGWVERLLSWVPVVYLGRISYGIYLFHPFVNASLKKLLHMSYGIAGEASNRRIFPAAILITGVVCALLYRLVEVPVRAWGERRAKRIEVDRGDDLRTEQEAIAIRELTGASLD